MNYDILSDQHGVQTTFVQKGCSRRLTLQRSESPRETAERSLLLRVSRWKTLRPKWVYLTGKGSLYGYGTAPAWEFRDTGGSQKRQREALQVTLSRLEFHSRTCVSNRIVSLLTLADRWGIGCCQEAATWRDHKFQTVAFIALYSFQVWNNLKTIKQICIKGKSSKL